MVMAVGPDSSFGTPCVTPGVPSGNTGLRSPGSRFLVLKKSESMKLVGSKPSQPASRTPSDNAKTVRPMRAKRFMLRPSTLARAGAQRHQLLDAGAGGGWGLRIRHDQIEPVLGRPRVAGAPSG